MLKCDFQNVEIFLPSTWASILMMLVCSMIHNVEMMLKHFVVKSQWKIQSEINAHIWLSEMLRSSFHHHPILTTSMCWTFLFKKFWFQNILASRKQKHWLEPKQPVQQWSIDWVICLFLGEWMNDGVLNWSFFNCFFVKKGMLLEIFWRLVLESHFLKFWVHSNQWQQWSAEWLILFVSVWMKERCSNKSESEKLLIFGFSFIALSPKNEEMVLQHFGCECTKLLSKIGALLLQSDFLKFWMLLNQWQLMFAAWFHIWQKVCLNAHDVSSVCPFLAVFSFSVISLCEDWHCFSSWAC